MEKVIVQTAKQIVEKIKKPDGYQKELEEALDAIVKSTPHAWPFSGITQEDLLSAIRPMVDIASSIEQEYYKIKGATPEVLQDRIAYKTIDLLKCVNQMEYETSRFEANHSGTRSYQQHSQLRNGPTHIPSFVVAHDERNEAFSYTKNQWLDGSRDTTDPFTTTSYKLRQVAPRGSNNPETRQMLSAMRQIVSLAKDNLYTLNQEANEQMQRFFPTAEVRQANILGKGDLDSYIPAVAIDYTKRVAGEHEQAYAAILDKFEQILKYGLPSETNMGQFMDKLAGGRDAYKKENEALIKSFLSKEMDMEVLENFFIPRMKLEASVLEGQMKIEGRLGNATSYRQLKNLYHEYVNGHTQSQRTIDETRTREAKMMPELGLSIEKGKDGTYVITVSRGKGEKREVSFKSENESYQKTDVKNRKENTRVMTLGQMSQALREEKRAYSMIVRGTSAEFTEKVPEAKKRDTKITYSHDMSFGEAEVSHTRTTRHSGKRSNRANLHMDLGKMEGRIIRSHREGLNRKQDWNIGASAQGIGASASMSTPTIDSLGTPKLSAEAHLAKGSVNFKQLEASFNIGAKASVGVQITPEEISKRAAMILVGEALKGNSANLTRIADEVMDLIKSAGPSSSIDFTKINISAASLDLLNAELIREQNQEIGEVNYNSKIESPIASDIKEDIDNVPTYYDQVQDMVQFWGDITIEREQDQQLTDNTPMYSQDMGYVANQESENQELADDEQEYGHYR